jgi:hypothetical protein
LPDHQVVLRIGAPPDHSDADTAAPVGTERLLIVDDSLLDTSLHVIAFILHLRALLTEAGVVTADRPLFYADLLCPELGLPVASGGAPAR